MAVLKGHLTGLKNFILPHYISILVQMDPEEEVCCGFETAQMSGSVVTQIAVEKVRNLKK